MTETGQTRPPVEIRPVADDEAAPDVKRIFEAMAGSGEVVTPFFRMLAHKPAMLRAFNQLWAALWAPDSKLPEKLKDLAYLRASIVNSCEF